MKVSKPILITASAAIAGALGLAGLASAQGTSVNSLANEIAGKFHLNASAVQQVIDQHKGEVQQNRQQNYQARLDQAVKDGKLTSDQETKILAEHQHLLSEVQALMGKAPADRRAAMQNIRSEITQWEKDNGIPPGYLGFAGRGFGGRHRL